jgi:excisionase family DNA binding protein
MDAANYRQAAHHAELFDRTSHAVRLGEGRARKAHSAAPNVPEVLDMTLEQAAARLGLAASTLRVQIRNGKLRAKKVGRDWTVSEREVERYRLASKRLPPSS